MSTVIGKPGLPPARRGGTLQTIGWQVGVRSYAWSPPTDVYETEASFIVRLEVAGMNESDFNIQVGQNMLVIGGTRFDAQERRAYRQMEIRYGEFSTAVELPPGLDVQHADANYEDGFLVVVFPKLKPTGIAIQG